MSFTQKRITVQIALANGQFNGGGNTAEISGLRVSAQVNIPGGPTKSSLSAAIYGLPLSMMNQLSTVGTQYTEQAQNTITVMAGDAVAGMAQIYKGTLFAAYVDAQGMPEVALRVRGMTGLYEAVKSVPPTSIQGSGDVATIMQGLASQMGLQFENNGVNVKLANPYLSGPSWLQALTVAQHAGIEHIIDNGVLAIWKPGRARQGGPVMISPQTGMIGYPMFSQPTVIVRTLFDPTIKYGGSMQIQSDLTPACGTFVIRNVDLELESLVPHGRWFATLSGVPQNLQEVA